MNIKILVYENINNEIFDGINKKTYDIMFVDKVSDMFEAIEKYHFNILILNSNLSEEEMRLLCSCITLSNSEPFIINYFVTNNYHNIKINITNINEINHFIYKLKKQILSHKKNMIKILDLKIDVDNKIVLKDGNPVSLNKNQFRLISYLAINKNVVISKYELVCYVYQIDLKSNIEISHFKSFDTLLSSIRKMNIINIQTVHKFGYILPYKNTP